MGDLEIGLVVALIVGVALIVASTRERGRRRMALDRIPRIGEGLVEERRAIHMRRFGRRYRWIPWVGAVALALTLFVAFGMRPIFAVAFGGLAGVLGSLIEEALASRALTKIELQLADAIDLMVASLRAGAGVLDAFDSAILETRRPLRPFFEDVLGRLRLGDDPQVVLRDLADAVPLETFRLLSFTLAVHWEVGGSLAPTLSLVGRTIRDRVELARRIRSQAMQGRASVVGAMLITYGIAVIMWRSDTARMEGFLATSLGAGLTGIALLLQAAGLFWMSRLSRVTA